MLVVIMFAGTIVHLESSQSEEIFNRILKNEYIRFIEKYNSDPSTSLPETDYMKFYIGLENIPQNEQKIVEKLGIGYYETGIHGSIEGPNYNHVAVQPLPDRKDMLYILLDANALGRDENETHRHMIVGLVVVSIFSFFVAFFISNRVSRPLKQLVTLVDQAEPDSLPSGFSRLFSGDEVGSLARALEKSMERVKAFLTREQQFSRDASHELRTPVTVVKGAVELLQQTPAYKERNVNRLVKRIEHSVTDMENTIEALLWLSREESASSLDQTCEIVPIIRDIVAQNQIIYGGKPIDINIEAQGNPSAKSPATILKIILLNLIRNAFQFTSKGSIQIRVSNDQVEISDTGLGIALDEIDRVQEAAFRGKSSQGFGFWLDIVKRLCEHFGWQLEIESTAGKGTTARLIF